MTAEQIAENFESVRNQIKEAEKKSGHQALQRGGRIQVRPEAGQPG